MCDELRKGVETETFVGTADGSPQPIAARLLAGDPAFDLEPDARLVEHRTAPCANYAALRAELERGRRRLWSRLVAEPGCYALPDTSLALADDRRMRRSKPDDAYHDRIERTYGTRVVSASIHVHLEAPRGVDLFRCLRVLRAEAPLALALTAASPFLDGRATGHHSTRWARFPRNPSRIPVFTGATHFRAWHDAALRRGSLWNERHLWASVRPQGPSRPHELDRIEVRICDRVDDVDATLAVVAWLEATLLAAAEGRLRDPLDAYDARQIAWLTSVNESAVAHESLDAAFQDLSRGAPTTARAAIQRRLDCFVRSGLLSDASAGWVWDTLRRGNRAMRSLARHRAGEPIAGIVRARTDALRNDEARAFVTGAAALLA